MSMYHCHQCDLSFQYEEGGAKLCPLCQGKLRIEDDELEIAGDPGKFRLWLGFWIGYLLVGPLLNLIPAMLFGVWATAACMMICGLLLAKVCEHRDFQSMKPLLLWSVAGLIPPVFAFYLLPGWVIPGNLPGEKPDALWAAGLFFFGAAAFSAAYFRNAIRVPASLGALALAIFFFYAEPVFWFHAVPVDREWSRAVNLTQTEPGLFDPQMSHGHAFIAGGKLYWQSKSVRVWNPDRKKWEVAAEVPLPETLAGLPYASPYEQPRSREPGIPAQPELVLSFSDPEKREVRRYPLEMRQLYPGYHANNIENVQLAFSVKKVLPDGRLSLTYRLTWHRFEYWNGTIRSSGDEDYLLPGTLTLNLGNGQYEVKRGDPLRNSTIQTVEIKEKLLVFFNPPYGRGSGVLYTEYDYEKGQWSDPETFYKPESNDILYRSFFRVDGDTLHCILGDRLLHRVRAPLAMLSMDGYGNPGELLYCRRDLKSGEWSEFRKLSPGIKFVNWPTAAKEGDTMAVACFGKQRGESMPPGEIPHLYYVLSRDGGEHWTPPQEIPLPEPLKAGLPKLAILDNTLHLFFSAPPKEDRWGGNRRELYHLTRTLPDHKP